MRTCDAKLVRLAEQTGVMLSGVTPDVGRQLAREAINPK
jgi:hypothetical protein